jgi:hypothetical protein
MHAGRKGARHAESRTLASGIVSLENHDDATLDEIFRRASALYQAAYVPQRNAGSDEMDPSEALIRMALPWHMAPPLLARMKLSYRSSVAAFAASVALDAPSGP